MHSGDLGKCITKTLGFLTNLSSQTNTLCSFDEIGEFDLPAMIDLVREKSGHDQIFYGGHSMGTTTFMVMANKKPEYQQHIKLASFLAPVAYVDHMTSPLKYVAPFVNQIDVSIHIHNHL